MASTALDDILLLLPDNNTNDISALDMRDSFTITFEDREVLIRKFEKKSDIFADNSNIYLGSLVCVFNDLSKTIYY